MYSVYLSSYIKLYIKWILLDYYEKIMPDYFVIISCYSQEALKHPSCYRLYITKVDKDFDCDVHFPDYDETLFKETR